MRLLEAAFHLILSLVLSKYLGLVGIVLGTSLAALFTSSWYLPLRTARLFNRPFSSFLRLDALPILAVALSLGPIAYGARLLANLLGGYSGAVIGGGLTAATGVALLWFIAFDSGLRRQFLERIGRITSAASRVPNCDTVGSN
jgi:hypothetical protein